MLTYTLAEFLENDADEGDATIYVVRDGNSVLYVGKATRGVQNRWLAFPSSHIAHMDENTWIGNSNIGRTIQENLPLSRNWEIDLYTAIECKDVIFNHLQNYNDRLTSLAEIAMIQTLKPYLNSVGAHYQREQPPH